LSVKQEHIAAYVTNHGYGHVNRMVAVINEIDPEHQVTIRCDTELWPAFRERLIREVHFGHFPSDLGVLSPPGQNSRTDWPGTFDRLQRRYGEILAAADQEIKWLRTSGTTVVYADSSLIPLRLADQAGIPAFLGANFTWVEIYADLLAAPEAASFSSAQRHQYEAIIADMQAASTRATLLKFWPFTEMSGIGAQSLDVGMVVNPGNDIRAALVQELGLLPSDRLVYFYVGRYGVEDLHWDNLKVLPKDVVLIGFHPPGVPMPGRFFIVSPDRFSGADLLRSVDLAIVKAGYGAVVEAMSVGTPVIYPPRPGFAEFPALDHALKNWEGGYPVSEDCFNHLDFKEIMVKAIAKRPAPPNISPDGARRVAHILQTHSRSA
jgi:hypothetical protein